MKRCKTCCTKHNGKHCPDCGNIHRVCPNKIKRIKFDDDGRLERFIINYMINETSNKNSLIHVWLIHRLSTRTGFFETRAQPLCNHKFANKISKRIIKVLQNIGKVFGSTTSEYGKYSLDDTIKNAEENLKLLKNVRDTWEVK